MKPLTERQQQVLALIRQSLAEEGMPPTRAEIARALRLKSANTAEAHLRALAKKGYIELLGGRNRNIRLIESGNSPPHALPIVGRVAAGAPLLAIEHIEGQASLETLFHPRPDYLLRVQGMSMCEAGILDGDLLAVKRTSVAENGQIVVARLEDEVTVKRFERYGKRVRLLPENKAFAPLEVDPARVTLVIEGIVVGVIRSGRL